MQKKFHNLQTEVLFILGSTSDTRGRRCLVRLDGVENTIFQDDLTDTEILNLIGIEGKDLALIREFFNERTG
jgi:hypothetical protein